MEFKRLSFKHKNNKFLYYFRNYLIAYFFSKKSEIQLQKKLDQLHTLDQNQILKRVNYYNKLDENINFKAKPTRLEQLKLRHITKAYYFDLFEYARYFNKKSEGHFLFGDITHIPDDPSLTKTRPIGENNQFSILMKWNKIRHFTFIKKDKKFMNKKNLIVWRGKVHPSQPQRIQFLEKYHNHPLCNVGKVNHNSLNPIWTKPRLNISEQLQYKFILSIEGNDVASNLKWIMSSNSLAVMPKPKFESWFMEGLLIPDYHFVEIKHDYSDLEEKLNYYIENPDKASLIISNAHKFISPFLNKESEDLISLLVMKKYFEKTKR